MENVLFSLQLRITILMFDLSFPVVVYFRSLGSSTCVYGVPACGSCTRRHHGIKWTSLCHQPLHQPEVINQEF